MKRERMAAVVQVSGGVVASVGVGLAWVPGGLMLAGALAVLFGVALERG